MIQAFRSAALALCAAMALAAPAHAAWPERPVKLVVPYAPGGSTDQLARAVADRLSRELGQPVIVENRPGANTIVAGEAVSRAPADGYTLMMASVASLVLNPLLYKTLPYDAREFAPLAVIAEIPLIVVVNPVVPANTVAEFIAWTKANPGKVNYASVGLGNPIQLAAELFRMQTGADMTHIPYNGSAPALTALLAGDVHVMFDVVSTSLPHVRAGKLRALAATTRERLAVLPQLPTVAETGYPNYEAYTWFGVAMLKKSPTEAQDKVAAALRKIQADPAFKKQFDSLGLNVLAPREGPEVEKFVARDRERWGSVIRARGISLSQ